MKPSLWDALVAATAGEDAPRSDAALSEDRRELAAFGLPFEVTWMPSRGERAGIPTSGRTAFGRSRGEQVRREEAFWSGIGIVATPNRYPFYWPQLLLWPAAGSPREVDQRFLAACFDVIDSDGGTMMANTIGASASIPLAHAHLARDAVPVLGQLPFADVAAGEGWTCRATAPGGGVPLLVVEVDARDPRTRARIARRLLDLRSTPAANLLARGSRAWVVPRREETPAPEFPYAVGAGEFSGRFIYPDRATFDAATPERLEEALRRATVPATARELDGIALALPG